MLNIQTKLAHNMNDSSDMEIEQIDEINNFKGIYYNEDTEQKFYEHDAHFSFKDMCNRLEKLLKTLSPSRKGKTATNGFQKSENKDLNSKKVADSKSKEDHLDGLQASKVSNVLNKKSLIVDNTSSKTRNRGRVVSNHNTLSSKQQNSSFKFNSIQKYGSSKEKPEQVNKLVVQLNATSTSTKEDACAQPIDTEISQVRNIKVNKLGPTTKKTGKSGKEIIENNIASEKFRTNADDLIDQLKQSLIKPQNKSISSVHKSRNTNSVGPRPNKTDLGAAKSISAPKYAPLKSLGKPLIGLNQTTTKFTSMSQPKKTLSLLPNNPRAGQSKTLKPTTASQEKKKLPSTTNNFKKIEILKKPDLKKLAKTGKYIQYK